MMIQKQKLEQQTMRRIYFMGETPAEIEANKEIKRSDPKRYGVKRLQADEKRLQLALKKSKGQQIETYDFYMQHLVNENDSQMAVKGPSDQIIDKLFKPRLEKSKDQSQVDEQQD